MLIEELIADLGYVPEDDSWDTDGRLTYVHEDDATPVFHRRLRQILAPCGWQQSQRELRVFHHSDGDMMIELEPGGSEVTGHFLHLMRRA